MVFLRVFITWWIMLLAFGCSHACLSPNHYKHSCPSLLSTVKSVVKQAVKKEARIAASILRLHFHDCFVQGCDASNLLDGSTTEKHSAPNNNSLRGFEVIDDIKTKVEAVCGGVVSCADILALAARDSVVELGGPKWRVLLGRLDSRTGNPNLAKLSLPGPNFNITDLTSSFRKQGLSIKDMVALSGGHTIGLANCITFRNHIYNDTNINPSFAKSRQAKCPSQSGSGDYNLAPIDRKTPYSFDNKYFKNLIKKKALFHSDQELFNGVSTDSLVRTYAKKHKTFFADFSTAMVKMGNIQPPSGISREIRRHCRKPN